MNPRVSIIVPVYNCGNGNIIRNLVADVLSQTEPSWELMLCNDGSSDNTLEICNSLKSIDSRIKVIDNPHKGVSATRNAGIDNAKGEWVTFVDADDHLTGFFLESMLMAASKCKEGADMVCCSYAILSNNRSVLNLYSDSRYIGGEEIKGLYEETDFLKRCSPWARMFKREIIEKKKLRFNERLSHSEDRLFVYNYLKYIDSIATCSCVGYIYESFSAGSLKHKVHPAEMLALRQCELSKGAYMVMEAHHIAKDKSFQFANNLLNLLLDAAQSISRQKLNKKVAEEIIKQLVQMTLSIDGILTDKRTATRVERDLKLSWLLSGNYDKFINAQRREDSILKFKQSVKSLIKKNDRIPSVSDYIKKIN